uniref:Major facilitator superfamily (MFS) profile domain-containing protein n=2 Tax=Oryza TaxID=4527 RepID=A0A0E0AME0_9ORYZ
MVRGNGVVASVRENSMETTPYDDIYLEPSDLRLRGFPREDIVTSSPGAYKREWLHPLTYYLCVVSPRLLARRVVVFFINRRRQPSSQVGGIPIVAQPYLRVFVLYCFILFLLLLLLLLVCVASSNGVSDQISRHRGGETMDEAAAGQRASPLLAKNDGSSYGEESQSLLEEQEPQVKTKQSGWRAPSIILGLECLESMAFNGIATNLVVYIRSVLHGGIASSASTSSLWYGTSFFVPILGATIADTYWGNYKIVLISFIMYLLGTVFITVGAFLPSAPALCNTESCSSMNGTQHLVYFSGLYLTAIGCGGVRSALLPLGADQFNNDSSLDIQKRRNFFSLFYICVIFGVITSGTIVVWIQENVSWAIGYGVATACIALALIGFLVGTPIFRRHEPHGSPVRSVFQVIVASFRNLALELPADSSLLYEVRRKNTQKSEPKLAHTDDFRFLDKAAIMSDLSLDQDSCTSPWRICTVTQVEELKILIRLLPIWATGIFFCVGISQMHTTFIQQGTVMNTKIGSLSIPAASLYSFEVICVTFWVFLVNKVIIPVTRACFANGAEMTQLQRIGIGRFLMIFAMAIAAFLEMKRLESVQGGDQPLSIAWQLPQYFVIAGAECFTIITQLEFFHGQAPDSMKSMLTAFALLTTALGNYFSSAIITLIARVTGTWHSPGWIPDDLNKGHLDYYYWCLAAISAVNFVVYIYFASKYKLKKAVIQV